MEDLRGPRSSIVPKARQSTIFLAAVMPMIRKTRNNSRNKPARNFAIAIDAPAMVVNPRSAAMIPITRNTSAMCNMVEPPADVIAKRMPEKEKRLDVGGWGLEVGG